LCAVDGNRKKAVEYLLENGARSDVINAHNHGAVEICALKIYIEMLK
jgi:ankyrin repeat protein